MRKLRMASLALSLIATMMTTAAPARELTLLTWNLGWHLDDVLSEQWMEACGSPFAKDPADGLWKPHPAGPKTGWQLHWGRDAPIAWDLARLPPCDVYQQNHRVVPATAAAYAKRGQQIAAVIQREAPDVLAFQEVSGQEAVRDVLPEGGKDYHVCSFDGFKVQRLAFAWRRTLGEAAEPCAVYAPLALPARPPEGQPRPGLALGLRVDGQLIRFLNVHLKSACVSPLESADPDGKGQLAGNHAACRILQDQLPPLEAWLESKSEGADLLVLLGDFNRNLVHEAGRPANEPVRSAGKPTDPYRPGVRSANLWREINDGEPARSTLTLLPSACPDAVAALCEAAKGRLLAPPELNQLTAPTGLGCRNPLGLDHVAVSGGATRGAVKVPLGKMGRTLAADAAHPDPLLALSDHCPLRAWIRF